MKKLLVVVVCGSSLSAAVPQVMAAPDELSAGYWEATRWSEPMDGGGLTVDRSRRTCVPAMAVADLDYLAVRPLSYLHLGSSLQRVTNGPRRRVQEEVKFFDRRLSMHSPWMTMTRTKASLSVAHGVAEASGPEGLRSRFDFRRRVFDGGRPTGEEHGFAFGYDARRLGDCPSEFRFMTLREIWQSIFQWGF